MPDEIYNLNPAQNSLKSLNFGLKNGLKNELKNVLHDYESIGC